jgi:hypothetical protein
MLTNTLKELQQQKAKAQSHIKCLNAQIKNLDQAIEALSKLTSTHAEAGVKPAKKRTMPASAIAKIRAAQKKRWAKVHEEKAAQEKKAAKK